MLQLVRILDALPSGFETLRAEADAEGHRNLSRLAVEWAADPLLFEAVLAAFQDGELVGVGALSSEPAAAAATPALRMRRFFVTKAARRQGVGRALAGALALEGLAQVPRVTVHAGTPAAAAFWEAMGFAPVAGHAWSHSLERG